MWCLAKKMPYVLMFLIDSSDGQSGYPIDSPMSRGHLEDKVIVSFVMLLKWLNGLFIGAARKMHLHLFINNLIVLLNPLLWVFCYLRSAHETT
jgi:hypothetical protein